MGDFNKDGHLNNFSDTGSALVSRTAYEAFMEGRGSIGYAPTQNDPQGSMFVAPKEEIDRVLQEANGDISKVEKALGLPEGYFGDGSIMRVDIQDIHNQGLRVANGQESGANEYWNTKVDSNGNLPDISYVKDAEGNNTRYIDTSKTDPVELGRLNGQYWDEKGNYHKPNQDGYDGKTSTGINEGVINRVPNTAENVSYTELKGFSRGESSNVTATKIQDGYGQNSSSAKDNIEKLGIPDSKAPPVQSENSDLSHAVTSNNGGNSRKENPGAVTMDQLAKKEKEPAVSGGQVSMEQLERNKDKIRESFNGQGQFSEDAIGKGIAHQGKNNNVGLNQ